MNVSRAPSVCRKHANQDAVKTRGRVAFHQWGVSGPGWGLDADADWRV